MIFGGVDMLATVDGNQRDLDDRCRDRHPPLMPANPHIPHAHPPALLPLRAPYTPPDARPRRLDETGAFLFVQRRRLA